MTIHKDRHAYVLPSFHTARDRFDHEIVQMFHHCFYEAIQNRVEIRILASIRKVAIIVGHGDAYIAKILVDNGLRAGRLAFPQDFLDHADKMILIQTRLVAGMLCAPRSLCALMDFWHRNGDDPLLRFYGDHEGNAPCHITN